MGSALEFFSCTSPSTAAESSPLCNWNALGYSWLFDTAADCEYAIYFQSYAGASVGGAQRLNHGYADTVVNWSGGMHHAKKAEVGIGIGYGLNSMHPVVKPGFYWHAPRMLHLALKR